MFNMSDLPIELKLTEKSYTFLFKDTSLDSVEVTFMSFVSSRTDIFGDKTFQAPVHLSKLIMSG